MATGRRLRVFVSYVHIDDNKRRALVRVLLAAALPIEPIVIADRRSPGTPLTEKVVEGIAESDYFVPILTSASIGTQWVNQEIGYAAAKGTPTIALVESGVRDRLKGFIHDQQDLPFSFPVSENQRRQARLFHQTCIRLRTHLESTSVERGLTSEITPGRVRAGKPYTTHVSFRGTVRHGFFDNLVVEQASGRTRWNWDPVTLPRVRGVPSSRTPGTLNGSVDVNRSYSHSTAGWSPGTYKVYVRLYSHLEPGERGRQIIEENEHSLEVL